MHKDKNLEEIVLFHFFILYKAVRFAWLMCSVYKFPFNRTELMNSQRLVAGRKFQYKLDHQTVT